MKVKAYAKINLALDVVRKREDGYHELEMVMAPITLHDLIYINTIESGIIIETNSKVMPTDKRNIMYKVVALMKERYGIKKGVKIYVYKHIPTQAGLAGGSADGAAVIKAMNKLFYLNLTEEQMATLGKEVGADIPFCVYQKMVLLVKPKKGVSTKKSFNSLDLNKAIHQDCKLMVKGIYEDDYQTVIDNLQNTLEEPSIKMVPEINDIKQAMLEIGFDGALMSGSGSCVFGLTRDDKILEKGFKYFKGKYYFVRKTEILNER